MKKMVLSSIVAGAILLVGFIYFTSQLASNRLTKTNKTNTSKSEHSSCPKTGNNHMVIIQSAAMHPAEITAQRCDTLTITNNDPQTREIAFGNHTRHASPEYELAQGKSFTTQLDQAGTFIFHDHLEYRVQGEIVVMD